MANWDAKSLVGRAVLAAAYIVLGIIWMVYPGLTGIVICRAAGVLALAFGAARVVSAMREQDMIGWGRLDLVVGVLALAFGLFALVQPEVVLSILPLVLGIYLIVACVGKLQRSAALRRMGFVRWWSVLALGILAGILGIVLIVNPFGAAETMLMFLGASMVVDGAADLWVLWCFAAHHSS